MQKLIAIILLLISQVALAELKVKDYDQLPENQKAMFNDYINGAGIGISWVGIKEIGRIKNYKPLYCPPPNLALTTENYVQILKARIQKIKRTPAYEISSIEPELIEGLIDTFPCK